MNDAEWAVASGDERIDSRVRAVVARLPPEVQAYLRSGAVRFSEATYTLKATNRLGASFPPISRDGPYLVHLRADIRDDRCLDYVIAHELAHVVLNHLDLLVEGAPDDGIQQTLEAHADRQVELWGFGAELLAKCSAYPESPQPTLLVEVDARALRVVRAGRE